MSSKIGRQPKSFKTMKAERKMRREYAAMMQNGPTVVARSAATPTTGYQADGSYIDPNGVRMSKVYQDNLRVDKPIQHGKGVKGQLCNRSACQSPGAYWFNHSTRSYYCGTCADLINRDSQRFQDDFLKSLGHPLLTLDPDFADKAKERP